MARRFASSTEQEIEKLLKQKRLGKQKKADKNGEGAIPRIP